jgi:hypothetical protein
VGARDLDLRARILRTWIQISAILPGLALGSIRVFPFGTKRVQYDPRFSAKRQILQVLCRAKGPTIIGERCASGWISRKRRNCVTTYSLSGPRIALFVRSRHQQDRFSASGDEILNRREQMRD